MRTLFALLLCSAFFGCASAAHVSPNLALAPVIQLVDSIAWANELGEGTVHRVQVRVGNQVDTIPGILTQEVPLVVGTRLLGFGYEEDAITYAYQYDVSSRRVKRLRLPGDFHPVFSAPSLSPDGRHIAYVIAPGDATGWGAVRSWPQRKLILRSDVVEVPATDSPGHFTRWVSPDSAELFIETGYSTENGWYRVLGSVRQRRILAADTVRVPPWGK